MPPSFPRRRAVHRDENDEERSSSALQAHTLAQRDQRLVNPQGGANIHSIVPILLNLLNPINPDSDKQPHLDSGSSPE